MAEQASMILKVNRTYVRTVELQARLEAEKCHLEALKARGCDEDFRYAEVGAAMTAIADELAELWKEVAAEEDADSGGEGVTPEPSSGTIGG